MVFANLSRLQWLEIQKWDLLIITLSFLWITDHNRSTIWPEPSQGNLKTISSSAQEWLTPTKVRVSQNKLPPTIHLPAVQRDCCPSQGGTWGRQWHLMYPKNRVRSKRGNGVLAGLTGRRQTCPRDLWEHQEYQFTVRNWKDCPTAHLPATHISPADVTSVTPFKHIFTSTSAPPPGHYRGIPQLLPVPPSPFYIGKSCSPGTRDLLLQKPLKEQSLGSSLARLPKVLPTLPPVLSHHHTAIDKVSPVLVT